MKMEAPHQPSTKFCLTFDKLEIENHLKRCLELFKLYDWLIDCFLAEFFVENLWKKLPDSWQYPLAVLAIEDLHRLIAGRIGGRWYSTVLPLSLQAFIASCRHLALPRYQRFNTKEHFDGLGTFKKNLLLPHCFRKHVKPKKQHELMNFSKVISKLADDMNCDTVVDVGGGLGHLSRYLAFAFNLEVINIESQGHHKPIAEKFDKEAVIDIIKLCEKNESIEKPYYALKSPVHITSKVSPEIKPEEFLAIVSEARGKVSCSSSSAWCKKQHGSKTVKSVFDSQLTSNGDIFAARMEGNCVCKEDRLEGQTLKGNSKEFDEHFKENTECFILTGLHTCGDLSSTLIKAFVSCPEVNGLALIGCCYMKLTHSPVRRSTRYLFETSGGNEADCGYIQCSSTSSMNADEKNYITECSFDKTNTEATQELIPTSLYKHPYEPDVMDYGFPMSKFLRNETYQPFEWCAFELACHNLDNYCQRLEAKDDKMKLQCYRAVLEVIIRKIRPELKNYSIRCSKLKTSARMNFREYASLALNRINIEMPCDEIFNELQVENLLSRWKEVIIFYCLRLILGPVIETVILLDRMLFLHENGLEAQLCPVFDAKISPRNFAIIAKKRI